MTWAFHSPSAKAMVAGFPIMLLMADGLGLTIRLCSMSDSRNTNANSLMTKEQSETWTPAKMGRKGGKQRAKNLTKEQIAEISRKAGLASGLTPSTAA